MPQLRPGTAKLKKIYKKLKDFKILKPEKYEESLLSNAQRNLGSSPGNNVGKGQFLAGLCDLCH